MIFWLDIDTIAVMSYNVYKDILTPAKVVLQMTMKNKIGGIAAASLATLVFGSVGANHVGNNDSGNVSVTYDQLVNSSSAQTEQTSLSEHTVEVTVYSSATTQTTSATQTVTSTASTPNTTATTVSASAMTTTATTEPVVIDEEIAVTVYVSNSGKYHSKSNCSGMKHYTEMSLGEALDMGYVACKKCW